MLVGYARTSTVDQIAGFEAQILSLRELGCEKIFSEQVSSVAAIKPNREAMLDYVREGDSIVVTKVDRLARSMSDLMAIVSRLQRKNVDLRVISMNLDTATTTGRLLLSLLGAIAEFERDLMLERQREGIKRAKIAGKYKGRFPSAQMQSSQIIGFHDAGLTAGEIATRLNISRSSVYRVIRNGHH